MREVVQIHLHNFIFVSGNLELYEVTENQADAPEYLRQEHQVM